MEKENLAIENLKEYKERLDLFLKEYFIKKIDEAKKLDPLAVQTTEVIRDFVLSGGKRIRPALVYYGYLLAGGADGESIIKASMSIELVHVFLLVHDDIIDRDNMRHNNPTVHEKYRAWGEELKLNKNEAEHFGNSMAIVVGDVVYSMANEIMYASDFSPKIILSALQKIQKIIYRTIPGEMLDILMEARKIATENEIMRMYEGKTARYTFEGPLHLGVALAGKSEDKKLLRVLTEYSLSVGKAFQLQDDILGIFGDQKKIGKTVGADIIEGKQTLLLIKALELGNLEQRKLIKRFFGKKDLDLSELKIFRRIIKDTGSLKYSQDLSSDLIKKALVILGEYKFENTKAQLFLKGIAEYIIKREV
jgi:geranylgeranyl diphosphate synthase type I